MEPTKAVDLFGEDLLRKAFDVCKECNAKQVIPTEQLTELLTPHKEQIEINAKQEMDIPYCSYLIQYLYSIHQKPEKE